MQSVKRQRRIRDVRGILRTGSFIFKIAVSRLLNMDRPKRQDVIIYNDNNEGITTEDEETVLYRYELWTWYQTLSTEERSQCEGEMEEVMQGSIDSVNNDKVKLEYIRVKNRVQQRLRRERQSEGEKERDRERNRVAKRRKRSELTEEEKERVREQDRSAHGRKRSELTEEEKERARQLDKSEHRRKRSELTEEERERARDKSRSAHRRKRLELTEEERERAREKDRSDHRARRQRQTGSEKEEERSSTRRGMQKKRRVATEEERNEQRSRNTQKRSYQRRNLSEEERLRTCVRRQSARARGRDDELERQQAFLDKLLRKHMGDHDGNIFELGVDDVDDILTEAHGGMSGLRKVCAVCDCIQLHSISNDKVKMKALTEDVARKLSSLRKTQELSPMLLEEYDISKFCTNLNEHTKALFKELWLSPRGLYVATQEGEWRALDNRSYVFAVSRL